MSNETNSKPEEKTQPLESEKILSDIKAMQKGKTPPEAEAVKSVEEAPKESVPEKAPKPTVETPAPNGKAEEATAPADKKEGKPEVDIREWAKRKGFKDGDQESVLRAYREMERKLSQVNAERKEDVPRGTMPAWQPTPQAQPPWQPAPQNWGQPQQWGQPPFVDRKAIIEQEAARFNMTTEDFERLLPLVNEVTNLKISQTQAALQAKYDAQLAELNRGHVRNSEFNELLSDPLFTNEEVAFEINKIFESNPQRLKLEPTPWHSAFNEALSNIARRNLQANYAQESSSLPSAPPKGGGRSPSPVIPTKSNSNDLIEKFKSLDTQEMEKQLSSIGAIPPAH